MAHTEENIQAAKDTLTDLDTILSSFKDIQGKLISEGGKDFMEGFMDQASTVLKTIKAQIMVEFDLV